MSYEDGFVESMNGEFGQEPIQLLEWINELHVEIEELAKEHNPTQPMSNFLSVHSTAKNMPVLVNIHRSQGMIYTESYPRRLEPPQRHLVDMQREPLEGQLSAEELTACLAVLEVLEQCRVALLNNESKIHIRPSSD